MECTIYGDEAAIVTWTKGSDLRDDDDYDIDDGRYIDQESTSKLSILSPNERDDSDTYTCATAYTSDSTATNTEITLDVLGLYANSIDQFNDYL